MLGQIASATLSKSGHETMMFSIDDGSVRWLLAAVVLAVGSLHLVSRASVAYATRRTRNALAGAKGPADRAGRR